MLQHKLIRKLSPVLYCQISERYFSLQTLKQKIGIGRIYQKKRKLLTLLVKIARFLRDINKIFPNHKLFIRENCMKKQYLKVYLSFKLISKNFN